MMTPAALIFSSLVGISATVAVMLAVAWHDLGQPRHARSWAAAFALSALLWTFPFLGTAGVAPEALLAVLMPATAGLAAAAIAIGFRQRAGLPDWKRPLLTAAGLHLVALVLLRMAGTRLNWLSPMTLFNAVMYLIAARALRGRRQGERAAEHVAECGLAMIVGLNILAFVGMIGMATGVLVVRLEPLRELTMMLLPAIVAGVGLFTIILLTADLADRTRRLAATDMLTGLLNRRGFDAAARTFFSAARRQARQATLALIDLDHFKGVNDRYGHPAGDRVLKQVAHRLSQGIGRRDILARIGGEEFALIITDADALAALCAVEVLRMQVEALVLDLPEPANVTASFGVAEVRLDESFADLCLRADRALYRAKAEGRNRVTAAG